MIEIWYRLCFLSDWIHSQFFVPWVSTLGWKGCSPSGFYWSLVCHLDVSQKSVKHWETYSFLHKSYVQKKKRMNQTFQKEFEPLEISRTAPNGRFCSNQSTNLNPLHTLTSTQPSTLNPQPSHRGTFNAQSTTAEFPPQVGSPQVTTPQTFPNFVGVESRLRWLERIRMFLLVPPLRIRWMIWGRMFFPVFGKKNERLSIYVTRLDICYLFKVIFARPDVQNYHPLQGDA